ncbi:MAG TPA: DUF4315 family protein [Clostridiaceae bacterium]|jgi:replicative superfamily II helicase|nr:DUF4315 family protein [Clostridiaceae bacterium]
MSLKRTRQDKKKVQDRIEALKEKLRLLNEKETELENTEIVSAVRALKLDPLALNRFLDRLKRGELPPTPNKEIEEQDL